MVEAEGIALVSSAPARQKPRALVMTGPPGSGKGTHGRAIASLPGFHHCACGDVFRSLDLNSALGHVFRDFSSRGELVPDEVTVTLWRNYLQGMELIGRFRPTTEFLILDGIPRNARQAQLLDAAVEVVAVVNLECRDVERLVARMRSRALHGNRLDDADEVVIRHRLDVHARDTVAVLAHYNPSVVITVDASQAPLRVLASTAKALVDLGLVA